MPSLLVFGYLVTSPGALVVKHCGLVLCEIYIVNMTHNFVKNKDKDGLDSQVENSQRPNSEEENLGRSVDSNVRQQSEPRT